MGMGMKKIAVSFSGKDSTLALHDLLHSDEYEVSLLLATVTDGYNRTSIHGVREELLEGQAKSLRLPLVKVRIPKNCSNELYEEKMKGAIGKIKEKGITHIAFGDLFLEDVRNYREKMLKSTELEPVFPLWGLNTTDLLHRFLSLGYKTIITCVDLTKLSEEYSGKEINLDFLQKLPEGIDPCGENGEYHSFVYEGPIFTEPIRFQIGTKKIAPDYFTGEPRFCYTDLIPTESKK